MKDMRHSQFGMKHGWHCARQACTALSVCVTLMTLACADKEEGMLNNPRERPVNEDVVLDDSTWDLARTNLIDYWNRKLPFQEVDTSGGGVETRIEFFVENNYWFAAVISRRNELEGIHIPMLGWFRPPVVGWREPVPLSWRLDGMTMPDYLRLVESDSLWSLFGEFGFWQDTIVFEQLYWELGTRTYSDGTWWQTISTLTIEELESKDEN